LHLANQAIDNASGYALAKIEWKTNKQTIIGDLKKMQFCYLIREISNYSDVNIVFSQFNYSSGQPAPETITDQIYGNTLSVCSSNI
jgi:hypothetical protein